MSDAVDKHLDKAFASLDDVPARELHATSDAIGRRSRLHDFAGVFGEVAYSRQDGSVPKLADFHLRQDVERGGDELAEQIADAKAPFWRHVRDALAERHP
jgi:DNA topoisomerase IB